jgi:Amt family ammonium transporter
MLKRFVFKLIGFLPLFFTMILASPLQVLAQDSPPPKLDTGDTAWMFVSTALVMLMTVPGLAIFYGGLAKKKDVLNTIAMSLITYCLVSFLWVVYGYSLTFSDDIAGIIGYMDKAFLSGVGVSSLQGTIPELLFATYQLTFAAITVALICGAYIERISFSAWTIFTILWMSLVYVPVAHWVWGNGFLAKLGALDFAGGIVVHTTAGISALIGTLILGRRKQALLIPNNMTLVVIGTGLLWFGWFGFNAGSAVSANGLAAQAFLNTNTAAALGGLTWLFTEWLITKKPTILGICSGIVAGLATITPAAGFVNIVGAIIIGVLAGLICYFSVSYLKPKFGYDDALDVFGIHGVAGILGAILTGFLADPSINSSGTGLFYGNPKQVLIQLLAVVITIIYTGILSAVILYVTKLLTRLRVNEEEEIAGLDITQHGEKGYNI